MNQLSPLIRILLPAILAYLAFSFLGPRGNNCFTFTFGIGYLFNRQIFYQNSANRKYMKGDFDGALNDLKKCVSLSPKNAGGQRTYAYLLLKLGNTDEPRCR